MPTRRKKLSEIYMDGEEGNARPKTAMTGNTFNPRASSEGASKIDCNPLEPCNNHIQSLGQGNAVHCHAGTFNFSKSGVTVQSVIGRSTVTDRRFTKSYKPFAQLAKSEGAETEVILINNAERGIEGYSITEVPKNVDTISKSNIITLTKKRIGIFKGTLSPDIENISNQAAAQ